MAPDREEDPLLSTVEMVAPVTATTPAAQSFQKPVLVSQEQLQAKRQLLEKGLQDMLKLSNPAYCTCKYAY